jgi:hypothetical protein
VYGLIHSARPKRDWNVILSFAPSGPSAARNASVVYKHCR